MSRLLLSAVFLLSLGACQEKPKVPSAEDGAVITSSDPRDADQCAHQPGLAWCEASCAADASRRWCNV